MRSHNVKLGSLRIIQRYHDTPGTGGVMSHMHKDKDQFYSSSFLKGIWRERLLWFIVEPQNICQVEQFGKLESLINIE